MTLTRREFPLSGSAPDCFPIDENRDVHGRNSIANHQSKTVLVEDDSQNAVTNARFTPLHRLMVGPVSFTTTPVPFRKTRARHDRHRVASKDRRASACGSPTVVSLRLRSCVSPPALHFSVRRTAGRSLAKIHLNRSNRFICVYWHQNTNVSANQSCNPRLICRSVGNFGQDYGN